MAAPDFNSFFEGTSLEAVDPLDLSSLRILAYGPPGVGKTSFAASASLVPELSPVLYIDLDVGTAPLGEHGDVSKIQVLRPQSFLEIKEIYDKLMEAGKGNIPFKCIVLDTIDELQHIIMKHWENDSNTFAKWDQAYKQVVKLIDDFAKKLEVPVIALTHESREVVENYGSGVLVTPAFEGKQSAKSMPGKFDFVCRLSRVKHKNELKLLLTVESGDGMIAKKRFSNVPSQIGNPTIGQLYTYMKEYVQKHTKKGN